MNSNHSIAYDPNFPILRNCDRIRSIRRPYPCLQHIKQYGHKSTTAHIQKRQMQKGGEKLKSWVPFSSLCSSTKTFTTHHLSSNITKQLLTKKIRELKNFYSLQKHSIHLSLYSLQKFKEPARINTQKHGLPQQNFPI